MSSTTNIYRVEPLRTREEIKEMKLALQRGNKDVPKRAKLAERDVLLFLIGINTGLQVQDLVRLKVGDVRGKEAFLISEGKTCEKRKIYLHMLQREIQQYTMDKHDKAFLFPSQKGIEAISKTQVYRILTDAADWLGRNDIGTHTMRKTFGYHHYKKYRNIAVLQRIFHHAAPNVTKRYIGLQQEDFHISYQDFRLG